MGLLDFANTDDGMQALGLLGAAAPSMAPMNFAGRLAQAAQGYQGIKEQSIKLQMSKLQELRAQQLFEMQKDAYYDSPNGATGLPSAPIGGSAGMPGAMPGQPGQAPTGMPGQPSNGAPPNNLAAELEKARKMAVANLPGAKEALEIIKYRNDLIDIGPGIKQNRISGQYTTSPVMSSNGTASQPIADPTAPGGWRVIAPMGAIETAGAYKDREKQNDLVSVPDGNGGTQQMTQAQAAARYNGSSPAPAAPTMPQSMPANDQWVGPEPKGNFTGNPQEIMRAIARIPDPQQRMEATRVMQNQLRAASQGQAAQPAAQPMQPAQSGAGGGAFGHMPSAAELAEKQAKLLAPIQTQQKVDEASATGQVANGIAYEKTLGETHRENTSMVLRNREIMPLLTKVTTGQYNQENMVQLGNYIKNSSVAPEWMKGYADKIAGGDVNAAKVLENQLAAAGISTMLATLNKEGSPNRAMFAQVAAAQEGLKSGNTTLKDVFALQQRMYDNTAKETSAMLAAKKAGKYNPGMWAQEYAGVRDQMLQTEPAPLPSAAPTIRVYDPKTGKIK